MAKLKKNEIELVFEPNTSTSKRGVLYAWIWSEELQGFRCIIMRRNVTQAAAQRFADSVKVVRKEG